MLKDYAEKWDKNSLFTHPNNIQGFLNRFMYKSFDDDVFYRIAHTFRFKKAILIKNIKNINYSRYRLKLVNYFKPQRNFLCATYLT